MPTISDLRLQAATIKNATQIGENTATRVGTTFETIADLLEGASVGQGVPSVDLSQLNALRTPADQTTANPTIYNVTTLHNLSSTTIKVGTLFIFSDGGRAVVTQILLSNYQVDGGGNISSPNTSQITMYYRMFNIVQETWSAWTLYAGGGGGGTIDPYPVSGSDNAVASNGVFEGLQKAAPEVNINDLDDLGDFVDMQTGEASTYTIKAYHNLSSTWLRVGVLMVFANQANNTLTQICISNCMVDGGGNLIPNYTTNAMNVFYRFKQFSGNPPEGMTIGVWTTWAKFGDSGYQPDNEDIDLNANGQLQFANKEYDASAFSGLGRVYLRKNIVTLNLTDKYFDGFVNNVLVQDVGTSSTPDAILFDTTRKMFIARVGLLYYVDWGSDEDYNPITRDVNWNYNGNFYRWNGEELVQWDKTINQLTQAMVNAANTIYYIQYDYDLNGQTITLPAGCVLEFNGGSIKNGTLVGTNTSLKGDYRFEGVTFSGTFTNENIEVTSNRFGTTPDISSVVTAFQNAKINLEMDITTQLNVTGITHVDIEGNGHSVALGMMNIASNTVNSTLKLQNVFFDCSNAEYTGTGDKGLIRFVGISNGESSFYAKNCHFTGYKEASMIYVRRSASTIIEDCYIEGDTDFTDQYPAIQICECSDVCTIQRNTIKNACGQGINFVMGAPVMSANIVDNVIIESYTGGIVIAGGILYNSNICGNKLINTNTSQTTTSYGAAINCHGFQNLNLFDNYIDAPNSPASYLDIDGNDTVGGRTRGIGLAIKGNYCEGNSFAIVNIDGGVISDNTFISMHTTGTNTLTGNLVFERNSLKDYSTGNGIISYNSSISSDMTIRNNYIESSSKSGAWFGAYSNASVGNISIYGNKIRKYSDNAYVGWIPMTIIKRNLVIDDHGTSTKESYQFNTKDGLRVLLPFSNNRQVYQVRILTGADGAVSTTVDTVFKFARLLNYAKVETSITTINGSISPTATPPIDILYSMFKVTNYAYQRYFLICEPTTDEIDLIVEVYYKAEDSMIYS